MKPEQHRATAPEIFDVTIRDGSYVVDFQFQKEDSRLLYEFIDRCGFRYIEVGHGLGLNASTVKRAAASDEDYLSAAAQSCVNSRFGAFFIPGIGTRDDLKRARNEFGMHFVRIGNDPAKLDTMFPFLDYAKELGYEVIGNFMKSYSMPAGELAKSALALARRGADGVYVVDSAGGMLPDEVAEYVRAIRAETGLRVGFHGHNNLELAVANSIAAWKSGAALIDCSIGGLGRSAGNTRTEMLIPVLKALGVATPYDYHMVLRVWQQIIQPVLRRRPLHPVDVVGGYARIHSGLMQPFEDAARRHGVALELLLDAYGDGLHAGAAAMNVDELARQLRGASATLRLPIAAAAAGSLLKIATPVTSAESIRNTFRTVDEVLAAARVLATKSSLPVAALISIVSADPHDEPHVMAEFSYHDDHFIVIRLSFGAVPSFVETMEKYRGCFQILMFENGAPAIRKALARREADWRRDEKVLWANLPALKHHYLFSLLYQASVEQGSNRVLFVGGNIERIAQYLAPYAETLAGYCTALEPASLHKVGIKPVLKSPVPARKQPVPDKFDFAVLLSTVNSAELQAILRQLTPTGLIVDCLDQLWRHRDLLDGSRQRTMSVALNQALTGAMLNLTAAPVPRPTQQAGAELERNENVARLKSA